jgi:hypothetical protein
MIKVKYNFYEEYDSDILNNKIEKRINCISQKNFEKDPYPNFLQDFFVDIFSWSVFPKKILKEIEKILIENKIDSIYDLSCGNGFHIYLFNNFTKIKGYAIDIQNEEESWSNIIVDDARKFIKKLKQNNKQALLLSWIDYDELALELVKKYKGNLVISVGNYELRSKKYLEYLHSNYKLIKRIVLYLPWKLIEKIEIYKKLD